MFFDKEHFRGLNAISSKIASTELINIIAKEVWLAEVSNSHLDIVYVSSIDWVDAFFRFPVSELEHDIVTLDIVMSDVVLVNYLHSLQHFKVDRGIQFEILSEGFDRITLGQAPLPETTVVFLHNDVVRGLVNSKVIQVCNTILVPELL